MTAILSVRGLSKRYGGIRALDNCSLSLDTPGIYGVIGPNGAGKTTLFDVLTGQIAPDAGRVLLFGENIGALAPQEIARRGVSRTFQECRVFPDKTCLDNLLFAAQPKLLGWAARQMVSRKTSHRRETTDEALRLLSLVNLGGYADEPASVLSFGQRRLLEIVAAFIVKPRIVLFDEPSSGINPTMIKTLKKFIETMQRETAIAFVVVEHNMEFIMGLSDHIFVMHQGTVLDEGTPEEVRKSQRVIDAYLG